MNQGNALDRSTGAVMVVGGGIAGVQAALDLANSGFYVISWKGLRQLVA